MGRPVCWSASARGQEALLQRLETTTGQAQDAVLTQWWRPVFSPACAEETEVWPVVRAVSADGGHLILYIEPGHQKLDELTADLDRTRPGAFAERWARRHGTGWSPPAGTDCPTPSQVWVLGPVIGTAFLLGARRESAHARAMEARRGTPPAPAAHG